MHAMQASTENEEQDPAAETATPEADAAPLEALVTQEQVLSASVARRRRKFSKKRPTSANRTRELTPAREVGRIVSTTETDDDVLHVRPKTPERRRKKVPKPVSKQSEVEKPRGGDEFRVTDAIAVFEQKSQEVGRKKQNLSTKEEFLNLFDRAKTHLTRGRDKYKKSLQRSKSTPNQLTEKDLIESFRRAQLYDAQQNEIVRSKSSRKYSTESSLRSSPERIPKAKPLRPEASQLITQRKKQRQASKKIIEIIDPSTVKRAATIPIYVPKFSILNLFRVLRTYTAVDVLREFRLFRRELRSECNRIRRLRNKCIAHIMIIVIYCGLAGMVFKFTEGAFENYYKCGVKRVKRDFIELLWQRSHNLREEEWKSLARNKLRNFEDELHQAHEAGMHSYSGQRAWSFLNGLVYSLTVVTTVGYGHMYPTTITGRALTIVYAIIGIPLFLIALTDFGKLFTRCIKFLWSFIRRLYYTGSCRSVRKTAHVQEIFKGAQLMYEIATFRRPSQFNIDPEAAQHPQQPVNPGPGNNVNPEIGNDTPTTPAISNFEIDDEFNLPISVAIFILVLYIFLGAVFYSYCEGWDFFESFYFVFISMSTIGFGDLVPRRPEVTIISIVYLVFGLALMSMCINVVQVKLSDTFQHASHKIGATIGLQVAEDDGSITTVPPVPVEIPDVHGTINSEAMVDAANEKEDKKED